jgi:hypothetical protein
MGTDKLHVNHRDWLAECAEHDRIDGPLIWSRAASPISRAFELHMPANRAINHRRATSVKPLLWSLLASRNARWITAKLAWLLQLMTQASNRAIHRAADELEQSIDSPSNLPIGRAAYQSARSANAELTLIEEAVLEWVAELAELAESARSSPTASASFDGAEWRVNRAAPGWTRRRDRAEFIVDHQVAFGRRPCWRQWNESIELSARLRARMIELRALRGTRLCWLRGRGRFMLN